MLVIWTGADARTLRDVVGPVITSLGSPPHKIEPDMSSFPAVSPGDVVLACGSKAVEILQGSGLVPKNRTVTSLREKPVISNGIPIFVTFDPSLVYRDYARRPEIQWDIRLAHRYMMTNSLKPKVGTYRYVESLHELIEKVESLYEKTGAPVPLASDLETKGNNPYLPGVWIISISFTVKPGLSDVMYFERHEAPSIPAPWVSEEDMSYWEQIWTQINWLLTTPKVATRGANYKYDSNWMVLKWRIYCSNQKMDTMLVGSLLDENRCVAPETLILTADLSWVRADSLKSGDSIVGFDEHGDEGTHRRMRKSLVSSSELIQKKRLRLNLSNGHSVVVSDNHQFLCKKYPSTHVKVWRKAKNIKPGCVIFSATPHPQDMQGEATDYELGRLSGFLDGEGSVPKLNDFGSWHLGWGQIPHSAHQDMKRIASLIGAEFREHDDNLNLCKSVVFKGSWNSLHALVATRPLRLVANEPWDNGPLPRGDAAVSVSVVSVEVLDVGPVVALETTTHTFIAEGLLSHNSNSLKLHAKIYTEMGGYEDEMDKYDFAHLDKVPKGELLEYTGGDTDATYRVSIPMRQELLKDRALSNFYVKLLQPSAKVFEKMERTGVLVDQDYYAELKSQLEVEIDRIQAEMVKLLPAKLRYKNMAFFEEARAEGKSLFKASVLKEFLFSPAGLNLKPLVLTGKTKEPSTAMDHLMMLSEVPEATQFIALLKELGSAQKVLSTYVVGFLKHLRPDGRFHGTYMLHRGDYGGGDSGTDTGRCVIGDTIITTNKGDLSISEVVARGEAGESFQVWTHKNRWMPVSGFWRNGIKPVCRVQAGNNAVVSTYNHPYMSFPSWKLAEDLSVGDWVYSLVQPPTLEEWRPVDGWPFEVSNFGLVRRAIDGKGVSAGSLVAQRPKGKWGHLKVTLTRFIHGREKRDFSVHILVAKAFLQGCGEVSHLNGIAGCNWSTNLRYVSSAENKLHQRLHGTYNRDSQKKLTWVLVDRFRAGDFGSDVDAAKILGVSRELLRDIRLLRRWVGRRTPMAGFCPVSISSISFMGQQETFDLTVEEDHSYIANGIVVHNTSCKEPALQCLRGDALVLTNLGEIPIAQVVAGVERGLEFKVLTHTGKWRRVVGAYRNGVQPVFSVSSERGVTVPSTGNHPYLTKRGWVRTDQLLEGDTCYELRSSNKELYQSNLPQLGVHEKQMLKSNEQRLAEVRGEGYHGISGVVGIQELPEGHGGEARSRDVYREAGCEWELRTGELCVGNPEASGPKSEKFQDDYLERGDEDRGCMGRGIRGKPGESPLPLNGAGDVFGESLDEGDPAEMSFFQEGRIASVAYIGDFETFDITVEGSHSFVANGMVVHNTVPKHSKWAKPLRKAFIAPPGKTILQVDFSQGELRICAVVAGEPTMIQAYSSGADLHAITAAQLNGYEFDEFMLLPEDVRDSLRSGGKAGNFGLIYGMQYLGFKEYAYTTYGVKMTEDEAFQKRESFFSLYNRLPVWHDTYKAHAHNLGFVRSPLGRVRHLPLINSPDWEMRSTSERQAINSPIQSCLSDMMQLTMVHLDRMYGDQIQMFLMVHDSLALYVPEEDGVLWAKRVKEVMENLPLKEDFGWDSPLVFYGDAEIGATMADLKKLKNL